jgi:hypothetical protein
VKKLPRFTQTVFFWMVLVSVGLHGLVLMMPLPPAEPTLEGKENQPTKQVKVVELPKPSPSKLVTKPATSGPKPKAQPSPKVARSRPQQKPIVIPNPAPSPTTTPSPNPTPSLSPAPSPSPTPSPTPETIEDVLQIPGAKGCNSLIGCWQVGETQFRSVAENLQKRLEQDGYQVEKLDDIEDDIGRSVYRVSKDGETPYYLNVLSIDQGTIYVRSPRLLSREELEKEAGISSRGSRDLQFRA